VLGAALCLLLLVKKEGVTRAEPGSGAWRAILTLLVVAGAGALGGMLAAAPAAYLFYALFSEGRNWRSALAAAVVSTLLVYVLFGVLLEVPLLRNLP
jgi:H+/gluconate symporter-like permease